MLSSAKKQLYIIKVAKLSPSSQVVSKITLEIDLYGNETNLVMNSFILSHTVIRPIFVRNFFKICV